MLAIRMKRIGRRGHAHFRVIVQDSRWSPKSGKFVAQLGSYDPHTKVTTLAKDKAETFLKNGAQPSERVAALLKSEGVKLPKWVPKPTKKTGKTKNAEKLRKNRPAEPKSEAEPEPKAEKPVESPAEADIKVEEQPLEEAVETEAKVEEPAEETSTEEPAPSGEAPAEAEPKSEAKPE